MKKITSVLVLLFALSAFAADAPKSKYGTHAVPLSADHHYLQNAKSDHYWAIAPFYVPQYNESACSLASGAIVLNALRGSARLTSDDELITQEALLKKSELSDWKSACGDMGKGIKDLEQLQDLMNKALKVFSFTKSEVSLHHADAIDAKTLAAFRADLAKAEKSSHAFVMINFLQGIATEDTMAGHVAPIGSYDAKSHKVLVMDPDRKWYEPYWVSDEIILKAMATKDERAGKNRGWILVEAEK